MAEMSNIIFIWRMQIFKAKIPHSTEMLYSFLYRQWNLVTVENDSDLGQAESYFVIFCFSLLSI